MAVVLTGRSLAIYNNVLLQSNEQAGKGYATTDNVLAWINECTQKIAERLEYWEKVTTIDATGGLDPIDLSVAIPDLLRVINIRWSSGSGTVSLPMDPIYTPAEFQRLRAYIQTGSVAFYYYLKSNELRLVPLITTTVTGALQIFHSYIPADLTGATGHCDPPLLRTFDISVYMPYCKAQLTAKDKNAKTAAADYQRYMGQFSDGMKNLSKQSRGTRSRLGFYR